MRGRFKKYNLVDNYYYIITIHHLPTEFSFLFVQPFILLSVTFTISGD
jgi:hypothetical protein